MRLISDGSPIKTKDGKYRLIKDWIFESDLLEDVLIVPKGFECDLASIPKYVFWWRRGKWDLAAIAHDFIYENGYIDSVPAHQDLNKAISLTLSKIEADKIFLQVCLAVGVRPLTARLMFWAVRFFGRGIWR